MQPNHTQTGIAEFINHTAHELKTPVTTGKVYMHFLEEYFRRTGDDKHLEFATKVTSQLERLTEMITAMIDESKKVTQTEEKN